MISRMKRSENCKFLTGDYSGALLKAMIGEMDFLIGQRTHSLIASVGVATPSAGLTSSIDRRTHEIMSMVNHSGFLVDIDKHNVSDAIRITNAAIENRQGIRTRFHDTFHTDIKPKLLEIGCEITTLLRKQLGKPS